MKRSLTFGVAANLLLLTGCASVCADREVVEMTPLSEVRDIRVEKTQSYWVRFVLGSKAQVDLAPCPYLPIYHGSLCVQIRPAEGQRVRLSSNVFSYQQDSGLATPLTASDVTYTIMCRTESGKRECSSREEPPTSSKVTSKLVRHVSHNGVDYKITEYSFNPVSEFVGATNKVASGSSLFSGAESRVEYTTSLIRDSILHTSPAVLHIPSIWIDGIEFKPPSVRLVSKIAPVCTVRQLM